VVYFIEPPFGAGFGHDKISAVFMAMPETAIYKYYGFVFGEYYIGFAGEVFNMEAVSETLRMEETAHEHFRLCVFAFDAAHVVAAGSFAVDVHVLQR